jgi:hypothetical protein
VNHYPRMGITPEGWYILAMIWGKLIDELNAEKDEKVFDRQDKLHAVVVRNRIHAGNMVSGYR